MAHPYAASARAYLAHRPQKPSPLGRYMYTRADMERLYGRDFDCVVIAADRPDPDPDAVDVMLSSNSTLVDDYGDEDMKDSDDENGLVNDENVYDDENNYMNDANGEKGGADERDEDGERDVDYENGENDENVNRGVSLLSTAISAPRHDQGTDAQSELYYTDCRPAPLFTRRSGARTRPGGRHRQERYQLQRQWSQQQQQPQPSPQPSSSSSATPGPLLSEWAQGQSEFTPERFWQNVFLDIRSEEFWRVGSGEGGRDGDGDVEMSEAE